MSKKKVGKRAVTHRRSKLETLESRRFLTASPAGGEFVVNATTANAQETWEENPESVALDDNGNFVVTWSSLSQDGDGWGVFAQRFNSKGVAQGGEFQVNQTTTNDQRNSAVSLDADGDFVISWSSFGQNNADWDIYARRYNKSGVAQSDEFLVNTTAGGAQINSEVATDKNGAFIVVWTSVGQDPDGSNGIFAKRYDNLGAVVTDEFQVNNITDRDQSFSRVAMDDAGDFVVVWSSRNANDYDVHARRYNSLGESQGGEFTVNETTAQNQGNSSIGINSSTGAFIVAWASDGQDPGGSTGVYAKLYNASGSVKKSEFRVNTTTDDVQGFTNGAMDANGESVVTWSSLNQDGSGFGIYAQQFDSAGATLGGETQVHTTTANDQRNSGVSMDAAGDFVVTWTNDTTDTANPSDVLAQRFVVPVGANTKPTTSGIADVTVNEDAADTSIDLDSAFADKEDADSALTYKINGNSNASLFASGYPAISGSPRKLILRYATNANGSSNITIRATDSGGLFVETTFKVTVTAINDAPTLDFISDPAAILEDALKQTVNLTGIGSGAANESQTISITATSDNKALIPDPTVTYTSAQTKGSLSYTPVANANGQATITVTVKDNGGTANGGVDTFVRTFVVRVTAVNDAPTLDAIPNPAAIDEDAGQQTVNLSGISAGPSNESQNIVITATSDNTALIPNPNVNYTSANATGSLSYAPLANANGKATITVTVQDNGGTSNGGVDSFTRTFTVNVNPVNDGPPTASDLTVFADEDTNATITLDGSVGVDTNETLSATVTTLPSKGSLFQTPDGVTRGLAIGVANTKVTDAQRRVIYVPAANDFGSPATTFQFKVNDGQLDSTAATVTINVNPVNDAPTLNPIADPPAILEDAATQTVNFSGIGSGASNETQNFTVTAISSNPSIVDITSVNYASPNATGSVSYTPQPNANGVVIITVTVKDDGGVDHGGVDSRSRTFSVTVTPVNDGPPTADDATVSLTENTQKTIALTGSVGVDTNETLRATITDLPTQGTLFQTSNGVTRGAAITSPNTLVTDGQRRVIFVPVVDTRGTPYTTFRFTMNDGQLDSAAATVTVNVIKANGAPTLDPIPNPSPIDEDAPKQTIQLSGISSGSVTETRVITVTAVSSDPALTTGLAVQYTDPDSVGSLKYTPGANANGTAKITVTVKVTGGTSANGPNTVTQSFDVAVKAVNDGPPTADDATVIVAADKQRAITLKGSVGVDTNETLSAIVLTAPLQGALFQTSDGLTLGDPITAPNTPVTDAQRRVIFVPGPNATGTGYASFQFKTNDGQLDSAAATITIDIGLVNTPPVAVDDRYVLSASAVSASSAVQGLTANDTDAEGDPLSATLVNGAANGLVAIDPVSGAFAFTPGAGFDGLDRFTYKVSDGQDTSDVATVTLFSHDASVIRKLYQQVLLREPDDAGLRAWVAAIKRGAGFGAVAAGIFESNERLDPIITGYYRDYLGRDPDAAGLAFWRDEVWKKDGGPERVQAGLLASLEFFTLAGGTNKLWVVELYRRLLGRDPDANGAAFWESRLAAGVTRANVVFAILRSVENSTRLAQGWYSLYLGRNGSAAEINAVVAKLQRGVSQRQAQIDLIDGLEYRERPPTPAAGTAAPLA